MVRGYPDQEGLSFAVKVPKINSMNKHTNYEDNIFVLNIRIRMIRDLLILDTDAELFLNKTLDDLDFIDASLSILLVNLKENYRLIERDEQFHNLIDTERQFCEVLNDIEQGEGTISALQYPELHERTALLKIRSQERQHSVTDLITEAKHLVLEPVVSHDELHELLSR